MWRLFGQGRTTVLAEPRIGIIRMTASGTMIIRFPRIAHSGCNPLTNGGGNRLHAFPCAFGHIIHGVLCDRCDFASLVAKNGSLKSETAHGKADEKQWHPQEGTPEIAWWLKATKGRKKAADADYDEQQANARKNGAEFP